MAQYVLSKGGITPELNFSFAKFLVNNMVVHGFFDTRIFDRDQIVASQKPAHGKQEDPEKACINADLVQSEVNFGTVFGWVNKPVKVNVLHNQDPDRDGCYVHWCALRPSWQKGQERNKELTNQEKQAHRQPLAFGSRNDELGFFGQVRVPDQHILWKRDVAPEHGKREQKLTEIMHMIISHNTDQQILFAEV